MEQLAICLVSFLAGVLITGAGAYVWHRRELRRRPRRRRRNPIDPPFRDAQRAAQGYAACLQEQYGASAILIVWDCTRPATGGFVWRGSQFGVYAMAKRHTILQETAWAGGD